MARRRTALTPMSGELRIPEGWVPPGPVPETPKAKPEPQPPSTTMGMLGQGLKRLALVVGGISAGAIALSLALVFFADADAASTLPVVFYATGVLVAAGGLWSISGHEWVPEAGYEQVEKEGWVNDAFAYFGVGLTIIAIGVAFEILL
jgi:hypothetical protein